jgi:hypothetical protein
VTVEQCPADASIEYAGERKVVRLRAKPADEAIALDVALDLQALLIGRPATETLA